MKKLKIIGIITVIGILLSGCNSAPEERFTVVEIIKCDHHDDCLVKIDKHPWMMQVDGGSTAVVGDYVMHSPPLYRSNRYYIDGHDPNFEYDMDDWGEDNDFQ